MKHAKQSNQLKTMFTVLFILYFIYPVFTQTSNFPDTPAGKRAKQILEIFNSGDTEKATAYVTDNYAPSFLEAFPVEQHVNYAVMIHKQFSGMELREIESSSNYDIDFLACSPLKNNWLNVKLTVEENDPHKILQMRLIPAGAPVQLDKKENLPVIEKTTDPDSEKKTISHAELTKTLDAFIEDLVEKDEFSGTVLVAKDGKPIYTKAVGEASKSYHAPNKLDTKFCLGSMNKMFTGTAIMQLAQQGKLSVDDKVGTFLPDYPNEEVREKVTIHHLLTHTSGMDSYWWEFFSDPQWAQIKTVQDYDNLANKNPLSFEPGERFQYSNCGPLVLGLIIEKISGLSYDEYIRRYVTGPAGMANTDCYDISQPVENYAIGYTTGQMFGQNFETRRNNLFFNPVKGGPAGGGYSTVEDLLKFDIALRNNKLLDQKHFDLMTTGKIDRTSDRKYAYLFEEKFVNGHRIIGHGGGAGGVNSKLEMYMDSGYTVSVMSNYDPPAAETVADKIRELLID